MSCLSARGQEVYKMGTIEEVIDEEWNEWDVAVLARNWFVRKIKKEHSFLGKL